MVSFSAKYSNLGNKTYILKKYSRKVIHRGKHCGLKIQHIIF